MRTLLLFLSLSAGAQDQWLCVEDSSQVVGESVQACGVGEGPTEGKARAKAFQEAAKEFMAICGPNTECGVHKYAVEPRRATCEREGNSWKCYRLIVYRPIHAERNVASDTIPSQSLGKVEMSTQELLDAALRDSLKNRWW